MDGLIKSTTWLNTKETWNQTRTSKMAFQIMAAKGEDGGLSAG